MTRGRASVLAFFAGLGFFYSVSGVLRAAFSASLGDPPPQAWLTYQYTTWGSGAAALLGITCWAIYEVWKRWDE